MCPAYFTLARTFCLFPYREPAFNAVETGRVSTLLLIFIIEVLMTAQQVASNKYCDFQVFLNHVYSLNSPQEPHLLPLQPFNTIANYPLVIAKMKDSCRKHLAFINHSLEVIYQNGQEAQTPEQEKSIQNAAVLVLHFHFQKVSAVNRFISQIWNSSPKQANTGTHIDLNWQIMNKIAIKELIPSSQYVSLLNTRLILEELHQSPVIYEKSHIKDLLSLFYDHSEKAQKAKDNNYKNKKNRKASFENVIIFLSSMKVKQNRQECNIKEDMTVQNWKQLMKKE